MDKLVTSWYNSHTKADSQGSHKEAVMRFKETEQHFVDYINNRTSGFFMFNHATEECYYVEAFPEFLSDVIRDINPNIEDMPSEMTVQQFVEYAWDMSFVPADIIKLGDGEHTHEFAITCDSNNMACITPLNHINSRWARFESVDYDRWLKAMRDDYGMNPINE